MKFMPPNMGKLSPKKLVMIVVGILVLIMLGTSVFIVDQAEQAVITRFGRFVAIRGPGLHVKLPFRIERNYTVNVKSIQTQEFGLRTRGGGFHTSTNQNESAMLTGDLNIVDVQWIIQYLISDPKAWVFHVNDPIRTIRDVSRSAVNMLVGDRAIMDIMGIERSSIEDAALVFMNDTFRGYGLGINVIAVKLHNVTPPAGVQEAFEDVNKAMQDLERLDNEGQQRYNEEIPRARGEAQQIVHVAEGYRAERINRAHGDVARFNSVYAEFSRAPEITRQRLYYEMIEEVFKDEKDMTIIDRNLTNFLPLMNLNSQPSRAAQQAGGR